ncbi:glycosyltransferase family 4 protein [Parasediminibacterium sp. JCM 36343]|uniref:glycosyltransferase family 4 protein n=1 Tax=Parasediminibacterium sp. JCM 36343 TaxID=3374279 RepID=UPI00397CF8C7
MKFWDTMPEHIASLQAAGCIIDFRKQSKPARFHTRIYRKLMGIQKTTFNLLDKVSPDLVIINQGSIYDGLDWGKACLEKGIKYAFIVQLVNQLSVWNDAFVNHLNNIFSKAIIIFFVSKQNIELLESIIASKVTNATVIRNPCKENNVIPYIDGKAIFNIAFVASINSFHKGHDMLFEVLNNQKWKERNLRINLYGKGPNEQTLKRLKEKYQLDNVFFAGFEQDIAKIYKQNHAFMLCSRMEGQSLALIEAMYCGRVPIVTNVGGAKELIDNGIDGFIAKSPNVYEIDKNLEESWGRRHEWEEMGKNAAQKIRVLINEDPVEQFANTIIKHLNAI